MNELERFVKQKVQSATEILVEYSVSQINNSISEIFKERFSDVRVKGEISSLKIAASGHCYFTLKEDDQILDCVMWKSSVTALNFELQEGLEIVLVGQITNYGARSKYQMVARYAEVGGIGAWYKILEERKKRLAAEGLFDIKYKKSIPKFVQKVGIITSTKGAVIKDFIHRIKDRFPCEIYLYGANVQGMTAASEIIAGLQVLDEMKLDVIVIARGGGSFEDLLPFSEELLARAIFACKTPIVSAIGHETDFSIADYVADLRAPTPTAAAELITPSITLLKGNMKYFGEYLFKVIARIMRDKASLLEMQKPTNIAQVLRMKTDKADAVFKRFEKSFHYLISSKQNAFLKISISPQYLQAKLKFKEQIVESQFTRLESYITRLYKTYKEHLSSYSTKNMQKNLSLAVKAKANKLDILDAALFKATNNIIKFYDSNLLRLSSSLEMISYRQTLERGYAIIASEEGKIIRSVKALPKTFNIKFHDGDIKVTR